MKKYLFITLLCTGLVLFSGAGLVFAKLPTGDDGGVSMQQVQQVVKDAVEDAKTEMRAYTDSAISGATAVLRTEISEVQGNINYFSGQLGLLRQQVTDINGRLSGVESRTQQIPVAPGYPVPGDLSFNVSPLDLSSEGALKIPSFSLNDDNAVDPINQRAVDADFWFRVSINENWQFSMFPAASANSISEGLQRPLTPGETVTVTAHAFYAGASWSKTITAIK